jgi:hypothetical protein
MPEKVVVPSPFGAPGLREVINIVGHRYDDSQKY